MAEQMKKWEERVHKVEPYTPGEQPKIANIVKLNTNENPYPPAPSVKKVLSGFDVEQLRKYPDPSAGELVEAVSKTYQVPSDQIFVGVGSDDVLAMSFLTFFHSKDPILFPDITYSFYDVWAKEFEIPFEQIPLKEDFTIDPLDYIAKERGGHREGAIGGIVIPNPNAPTGLDANADAIKRIIDGNPDAVVIIDEAYVDFGATSVLPLIEEYENLMVVQTFSKSRSLAGSRIGFGFGSKKLIKYLSDVKYSFNSYTMDSITLKIGAAALSDSDYFDSCCQKIIKTREEAKVKLKALGFTFPDSKTNFIFATHKSVRADKLFAALREAGIIVRYFSLPRIDNYLRITIGTDEQMQRLYDFLEDYLAREA